MILRTINRAKINILSGIYRNKFQIDGITSTELSAKGLLQNSTHLATCLQKNGHANINDTISIVSENRPEFPVVTYATLLLNCKVAPCNLTYSESEYIKLFSGQILIAGQCNLISIHRGI